MVKLVAARSTEIERGSGGLKHDGFDVCLLLTVVSKGEGGKIENKTKLIN